VRNPTVGIVGVPYDGATYRTPGSRFGPKAVRNASFRIPHFNLALERNPHLTQRMADCGDILISPFSIPDAYAAIEKGLRKIIARNMIPLAIGGDHSISLPILRALHAKHGKLALVQFDAHTDIADQAFGQKYYHGSMFRRAVEEGLIDPKKTIQVGIRKAYYLGELEWCRSVGFETISARELKLMGPGVRDAMAERFARLRGTPTFITFDMDFVDHAYAPGTGGPEPFGPTSFEAIETVRGLLAIEQDLVGFDINEICPVNDGANDLTTYLATLVAYEFVSLLPAPKK
jgi:agmatinase